MMRSDRLLAGTGGRRRIAAGALLLLVATSGGASAKTAAGPAVPEAVQREVQLAQDQLGRAQAEFEGPQESRSIGLLDGVFLGLEGALRQGPLPPRGRDLLTQAYELRGRAYFTIGLSEKASENFRLLIQIKPDHALSREKVSPKVVELFNQVKKAIVGYVAVSSKPAGARVTLICAGESKDLGLTDFFPQEVLAGEYAVEIAKEGYRTETRTLSIAPRATEPLTVELTRTLANVYLVTEPVGVEVWLDGELRVTTGGSLAPDLYEIVRAKGLEPSRASARTEIANLSLGNHSVEFRRKCYESVRRNLDTSVPQDYEAEPVRMDDSLASLHLTSDPPGAKIYLNGEATGVNPAELEAICSGKVRAEGKHQAGKSVKDLGPAKA